ncbi:hypothetical protein SAMN02982918_2241 [Saccharomonospora viridis]|jgi:hypothetical protein|uniref:Uncharacterized protein n=2 Tax=Saccharomonospora viridis TaxID=1852 RepID=C7MWA6_SACVD|nr:hypothetical protein Svir_28970 [Saccharomonospora viridis DSM 43017]KHF45840.1 hypothetical protein MINT15_01410 [Saccharomonospora viridis]SFP41474.1 hypothetical protein SAMN02982918_2241 [Saccharomonospora viridis]
MTCLATFAREPVAPYSAQFPLPAAHRPFGVSDVLNPGLFARSTRV